MKKNNYDSWRENMKYHVLFSMPNGSQIGLWIKKDETFKEASNKFFDNWYKVTKEKPELFGHIILDEKCPKCGERLHAKKYEDATYKWCPNCHLEEIKNN